MGQRFDNSLAEIKSLNSKINPDNLQIGEKIRLNLSPKINFYQVQTGDSLWKISHQLSTPLTQIQSENRIKDIDYLIAGEILIIPEIEKEINTVLYFLKYTQTDAYLVPEIRRVSFKEDLYLNVLRELINGPTNEDLSMPIPKETEIKNITIENATAYIDFSLEIFQANVGAAGEGLLLTAIANSLTEYQEIERVILLAEGIAIDSLGGHIELREAIYRNLNPVKYEN